MFTLPNNSSTVVALPTSQHLPHSKDASEQSRCPKKLTLSFLSICTSGRLLTKAGPRCSAVCENKLYLGILDVSTNGPAGKNIILSTQVRYDSEMVAETTVQLIRMTAGHY